MKEAVNRAELCNPQSEHIPKVGAIIATNGRIIGRGHRGSGAIGDDDHAELNAIKSIGAPAAIAGATLYTTLEPCTGIVRSKPLECCTELILQHKITKVFVGLLDPNPGVTGKGIWQLQNSNVEVEFFKHEFVQQLHALNAPFIRAQQGLTAMIVSPKEGERLEVYKTSGKVTFCVKCLNPPTGNTFLFAYRDGQYWPQYGQFRRIDEQHWEIDAHFGLGGEHLMQIVTVNDLGAVLIDYYRRVVEENQKRRNEIKASLSESDFEKIQKPLKHIYPGVRMTILPKGIRLEAQVTLQIIDKLPMV